MNNINTNTLNINVRVMLPKANRIRRPCGTLSLQFTSFKGIKEVIKTNTIAFVDVVGVHRLREALLFLINGRRRRRLAPFQTSN